MQSVLLHELENYNKKQYNASCNKVSFVRCYRFYFNFKSSLNNGLYVTFKSNKKSFKLIFCPGSYVTLKNLGSNIIYNFYVKSNKQLIEKIIKHEILI